ncbi:MULTISPECIES: sulfite exporter TauE/SafE family protein [Acidianus]|uniref:Probable membrane transporter protein n=1 Tax=Candidatus Acidianus copahuensis TaxID=1160895 RepID=A0A031LPU0_9CREN|nr:MULTISPECIES: sulfite exporter TauE/SafE family protein [Acidianus]EZQ04818.1 permease [Candidatus Acidianus copahuensis]NON62258.1 sulfite exporter TauE/SafE family protein [Acidianus sp. RZ1]
MLTGLALFLSVLFSSILAGYLGSLTGLGGGTILVPILTLYDGIPIIYATGASLISTISTSSGAASAYIKDRITNVKLGMSLEIATTAGSIVGSLTVAYIYEHHLAYIIYIIFGIVLIGSIYPTITKGKRELPEPKPQDWTTRFFQLYGDYYDSALGKQVNYWGIRWWLGEIIMFFAGFISGLLGIGSGALKVLGMDYAMNLPMKVTTTTSNFMIGVTAATGSSIYWALGYIQPLIAAPTAIGVLLGALIGTKTLVKLKNRRIRTIFTILLGFLGIQMILRGLGIV